MASQRDHQQHLKKVGLEGFALIEECYGRTNHSQKLQSPQPQVHQSHYQSFYHQVQHQQAYVCHVPRVYAVTKEPVTIFSGTSQHQYYGGRSVSEGGAQFFVAKERMVSSNEAARLYGGTMVIDYSKNKPLLQAYY
ncbi:hypothetical protein DITRI_Ditri08aG0011600 [Diplodiscus trichospermus]